MDFSCVSAVTATFEYDPMSRNPELSGHHKTCLEGLVDVLEVMPVNIWSILGTQRTFAIMIITLTNIIIITNLTHYISPLVCFENSCVKCLLKSRQIYNLKQLS